MATINENLDVLEVLKDDIKEAIVRKGVVIDDSTPFTDYATKIDEISSGGDYPEKSVIRHGMKLGYSNFETPDYLVFADDVTDFSFMFYNCPNLRELPDINTINATNMAGMFYTCGSLINSPNMDTSNVEDMSSMFSSCGNLTTISPIDTSNVTTMSYMFSDCGNLISIPELNTSNVRDMSNMFTNCTNLLTIPELDCSSLEWLPRDIFYGCTYLRNVGGFTNLRQSIDLASCVVLSQQSLNNIISKLIPIEERKAIRFYEGLEGYFSEEMIASATEKNWIISFTNFEW